MENPIVKELYRRLVDEEKMPKFGVYDPQVITHILEEILSGTDEAKSMAKLAEDKDDAVAKVSEMRTRIDELESIVRDMRWCVEKPENIKKINEVLNKGVI